MRIIAVCCNAVLLGFTVFVTVTDGFPQKPAYILFWILLIAVPLLNVIGFFRRGRPNVWLTPAARIAANILLLGFSAWAVIDQYPHPEEPGVLEFTLVVLLTPILSIVAIVRDAAGRGGVSSGIAG